MPIGNWRLIGAISHMTPISQKGDWTLIDAISHMTPIFQKDELVLTED